MKNSTRFVLIIILLVLSWWLQNLLDTKPELITREKTRFANYYLEDFTITTHDTVGKVKYKLSAKRLDNFEDEDQAEIQQIEVRFFDKQADWTLTAGKGRILHSKDQIDFYDGVKIFRPQQKNRPEFSIETASIHLYSERDILETADQVFIKSGKSHFQSLGLSFDNNTGLLELKSNVKGHYEE